MEESSEAVRVGASKIARRLKMPGRVGAGSFSILVHSFAFKFEVEIKAFRNF